MIIIKLQGGLGNQLFQYATALALAKIHNTTVGFDLSFFDSNQKLITPRKFDLHLLGIPNHKTPIQDLFAYELVPIPFKKKVSKLFRNLGNKKLYREASFLYNQTIFKKTSGNCHLTGYFQSEKYFKSVEQELRNTIQRPVINSDIFSSMACCNSVSLHVRRGDYINSSSTHEFHGVSSLDYYTQAIQFITSRIQNTHFFVFSDDLPWVQNAFKDMQGPFIFVDGNHGDKSYLDMVLMSYCKHHIIANSSFSWWGAWLNPSTTKIVIAPQRWFANEKAQIQTTDIIPESWIKI